MPIKFGSNIDSLRAQRKLGESSDALSGVFERLSSGQRINRASDDAAGLAVASGLRTDARVFTQGVRNLNSGIDLLNIAESALQSLSSIVMRQLELAEQAANGSYSSAQRQAMETEVDALSSEFTRIVQSTSYNNIKLLDGSSNSITIQAGYNANGSISVPISDISELLAATVGDGTFTLLGSYGSANESALTSADFNQDGFADLVTSGLGASNVNVYLGNGNGSFKAASAYVTASNSFSLSSGDFNGDGITDIVNGDYSTASVSILIGNSNGTFKAATTFTVGANPQGTSVGDFNGDGRLDVVTASYTGNSVSVLLGNGDGSFKAQNAYTTGLKPSDIMLGDINGDSRVDIVTSDTNSNALSLLLGNGDGTFKARSAISTPVTPTRLGMRDLNGDNKLDIVSTNEIGSKYLSVYIGNGDGTFLARSTYDLNTSFSQYSGVAIADFNGDGYADVATGNDLGNSYSIFLNNGNGTFKARTDYTNAGKSATEVVPVDMNGDGVLDLGMASRTAGGGFTSHLANTTISDSATSISVLTQSDAQDSLQTLSDAFDTLTTELGKIGASRSRIEIAQSILQIQALEADAAAHRILDVDVASEVAQLVRLQILQQAGAAILAQANQEPRLALNLLQSQR